MNELKIVRSLLNELNENITYCHWKSNQHVEKALVGIDDLDILVDRNQINILLPILSKLKFKHFYTPITRTYVGIEDYLGFDEETGKIIHLHLHYKLTIGEKHLKGFQVPYEYQMVKNRRWDEKNKIYCSSYFDELLLLILRLGMKNRKRDFFKRNVFEKSTKAEFDWLKELCSDFCEKIDSQEMLTERLINICKKIYNGDCSFFTMKKLKKYLYKDFTCFSQGSLLHNTVKRNFNELNRIRLEIKKRYIPSKYTFLRRRASNGGIVISFLGSDGAGKSSSIKEIQSWLKKVVDVRYFYLGSGDGSSSLLRKPLKFIKKIATKFGIIKKTNNFSVEMSQEKENKSIGFAKKLWIYTLAKERISKIKKLNRCKLFGYIVLTDRYPQNEFEGLCDGPKLKNEKGIIANKEKEAHRLAKLCSPDLAIKLIVSPEEAKKRKPDEINIETSRKLTERVKEIKFSESTKHVLIDADKKQDDVILEIKKAIWNAI